MNNVHTVAQLMTEAARAVQERDTDKLFALMRVSRDWLQSSEETNSQLELLESLVEVVEELANCDAALSAIYAEQDAQ